MLQAAGVQAVSASGVAVSRRVPLGAPCCRRQAPRDGRGRTAAGGTVAQLGRDRSPPAAAGRQRRLIAHAKPGETPEQALERRMRESQQVEERVIYVTNRREWEAEVAKVCRAVGGCRRPCGSAAQFNPAADGGNQMHACCACDALSCPLLAVVLHSITLHPLNLNRPPNSSLPLLPFPATQAGDKLVVLEIQSQIVCQSGFEEEPELQWKEDQKRAMEPCRWVQTAGRARRCRAVLGGGVEGGGAQGWRGGGVEG